MTIKLETNIPIPRDTRQKWPLIDMLPGMSFAFPLTKRANIAVLAYNLTKRFPKRKFTIRKMSPTECRVWRVK